MCDCPKPPVKKFYDSRTFWVGVILLVSTIAEAVLTGELTRTTAVGTLSAAAMVFLRHLTDSGILWFAPVPKTPEKPSDGS